MNHLPQHKKIIVFDGVCNLCNFFVNYVIKNDTEDIFRFVSLQSEVGKTIFSNAPKQTKLLDSVLLYDVDSSIFKTKSNAVIEIMITLKKHLWFIKIVSLFPLKFRDFMYVIIAKYRYLFFGRKDICMIPTPEIISKFI